MSDKGEIKTFVKSKGKRIHDEVQCNNESWN